jgi:uncharacterized protein YbjT (DUF2867 family)
MAGERILVSGANGRTGRRMVRALALAGARVRAFVRDRAQFEALRALGASDYAVGDMADRQAVCEAASGCTSVVYIGPPMHPDEVRFTQHFIDAAKAAEIEHFIYYSVMHPLRREVRHHRLKLDAEERLLGSDLPYTILQPSRYMQHLEQIWPGVRNTSVHRMPFSTSKRFSVVDLDDLAEATAIIATSADAHRFATYELAGPEALSQETMAAILSEELGCPVRAEAPDFGIIETEARAKGLSEDRIEQMLVMNRHYDRHGFVGNPNVLRWLLGREPTHYRDYVRRLMVQSSPDSGPTTQTPR